MRCRAALIWDDLGYHGILWASMEIQWNCLEKQRLTGASIGLPWSTVESFGIKGFAETSAESAAIGAAVCSFIVLFWEIPGAGGIDLPGRGRTSRSRRKALLSQGLQIIRTIKPAELLTESCQTACKPGSVPEGEPPVDGHSSGTPVAGRLARPTRTRRGNAPARRHGSLFDLAPGGVCRAAAVAGGAVRSYRTLSPLPGGPGGLLSVALSLGSPPPGITRHRVPVEPGLSSPRGLRGPGGGHPAIWHTLNVGRIAGRVNRAGRRR